MSRKRERILAKLDPDKCICPICNEVRNIKETVLHVDNHIMTLKPPAVIRKYIKNNLREERQEDGNMEMVCMKCYLATYTALYPDEASLIRKSYKLKLRGK